MKQTKDIKLISIIRRSMLIVALSVFAISSIGLGYLIRRSAEKRVVDMMRLNIRDVEADISDASDENLLFITQEIADSLNNAKNLLDNSLFVTLAKKELQSSGLSQEKGNELLNSYPMQFLASYLSSSYDLPEINIVDNNGIIIASSNEVLIGFDMSSGKQAAEFLCLLDGTDSLVQSYQPISYDQSVSMKYAGVRLHNGGFVQVGYDADRFQKDITDQVVDAATNRHVGESGYIIIVDDDGLVLSSPMPEVTGHKLDEFGVSFEALSQKANDVSFERRLQGEMHHILGARIEGYCIFALVPQSETLQSFFTAFLTASAVIAIVLFVVLRLILHLIKKFVVNSVDEIAVSLDQITKGDLNVIVDTRGTLEFDSLSDNINATVASLKDMAEKEAARLEKELEYAKNIQRSALPNIFPNRSEFELYATMDPAKEVGGDFFDFELINRSLLSVCVADVSGKGIPAALFMMRAKTLLRDYCVAGLSVNKVLEKVNSELCVNNETNMFVTCWFGILDTATGIIEYANAGHNPPLIRHNGSFEYLKQFRTGFILGAMDAIPYKKHEIRLLPGDELFLYTDGVTEATDLNKQLYGEERLRAELNSIQGKSCEEKCRLLRGDIDGFTGEAPQFDDITMLSLKYNGASEQKNDE